MNPLLIGWTGLHLTSEKKSKTVSYIKMINIINQLQKETKNAKLLARLSLGNETK